MLKKTLKLFFSLLILTNYTYGAQSDYITYEWLIEIGATTNYTDHIPHWRRLFNTTKVRGLLECGCGFSTKYLLDNAEKVVSIEYVTPGYGDMWYRECLNLYADQTNWIPMLYNEEFRSNSFNNATAYQCAMHKDYALIDAAYLRELFQHFKSVINQAAAEGYPIDVAFVDPGLYVRGDLVKLLLAHKIPIIIAHDTASDNGNEESTNLYGWNKVYTPENYVKIYIPYGQGTTFWISNQLPDVIASIQDYRNDILLSREQGIEITYQELTKFADKVL